MAWHNCETCSKDFWVGTPGRPPKRCNDCRGISDPQHTKMVNNDECVTCGSILNVSRAVDGSYYCPDHKPVTNVTVPTSSDVITEDLGKPNFYPGNCHYCGNHVAKEEGYRLKVNDVWKVKHPICGPLDVPEPSTVTEPNTEPVKAFDPATADITAEVSRITGEIVDPIVKRNVDRAITQFVNNTLPDMLTAAMLKAEVIRHEFVLDGKTVDIQGTVNKAFPQLMAMLTAGAPGKRLNIALPGPAGSGKSFMAVQAAEAMELAIGIISFGPITDTSKLFGYMDANGNYVRTPFREIWEHGGIFLADEMDNAHPGLLAELNQALAGDIAAFADGMVKRHPEFRCIATMNTFGKGPDRLYAGRNQLDAATLNRFVWLEVGYDQALETKMALAYATDETEALIMRWVNYVQAVRAKAEDQKLALVFGPRNTEQGAMLLANGMDIEAVKNACMFASVSEEIRTRIDVKF